VFRWSRALRLKRGERSARATISPGLRAGHRSGVSSPQRDRHTARADLVASLTRFIAHRLKLQINTEKSAVAWPWQQSFLGFTVRGDPLFRRCIADKAMARFKHRVRELTVRHRDVSLERMIGELVPYLRGWAGYFSFSQLHELPSLGGWIRWRLRWRRLGPLEDTRATLPRAPPSQCLRPVGQPGRLQPKGTLAAKFFGSLARRLHQRPFPPPGTAFHGETGGCLIRRTPVVRTRMPGGAGGVASRGAPLSRLTQA